MKKVDESTRKESKMQPNVELTVNFYQIGKDGTTRSEYRFKTSINTSGVSTFTGTAINRLFAFINTAKEVGAKTFHFGLPIHMAIVVNGKKYDTGNVNEKLTAKLKVQRNAKGYKRFAKRVYALIKFSIEPVKIKTVEDVIKEL